MNRSDSLLLENQVRNLDDMARTIQQMRSVLQRRINRLRVAPAPRTPPSRRDSQTLRVPSAPVRQRRRMNRELVYEAPRLNLLPELQLELVEMIPPTAPLFSQTPRVVTPRPEFRNKIVTKSRTLKKTEQEIILPEVCGICLENHKKMDTVQCNCNHEFGNDCLINWKRICNNQSKKLSCPTCRTLVTHIVQFRPRAPRTKKPAVISLIEEEGEDEGEIMENPAFHVIPLDGDEDDFE
jgi:hypothetical protein